MGRLESVRNALGCLEEQNAYDSSGNLLLKKDALGTLVKYTYDYAGRQKTVTTGGALAKAKAGGKPQPGQSYTYDARGNITGITDGEGLPSSISWMEAGKLIPMTMQGISPQPQTAMGIPSLINITV